jgi:transposase
VLLKDRERATAEDWLKDRPSIAIVARDRGGGYGEATARALPHAVQVADRWHLMENASADKCLQSAQQLDCRLP